MRLFFSLAMVFVLCTSAAAQSTPARAPAEQARQLYEDGMAHYQLGEYDDAIAKWLEGFRRRPVPELLYNLGQAYRLTHRPRKALQSYYSYLRMSPKAANRREVERYIVTLQKLVDDDPNGVDPALPSPSPSPEPVSPAPVPQEPTPPVTPQVLTTPAVDLTATAPPPKKPLTHKAWFWVAVVGGVAVVGTAIAVGVVVGTHSNTKTLPELSF